MKNSYDFWKKIWDSKGNSDSKDLLFLDGYDHLGVEFSSRDIVENIIKTLGISNGSSILEVGCGCGFLARELNSNFKFVGVDYSESIIEKHKELFDHEVYTCESNNLLFEDNTFDYVFCYGLFQYLPNNEYAKETISEMCRVSRHGVFIGDLKNLKTRETHFVFPKAEFSNLGFLFSEAHDIQDGAERYNAFRRFE